MRKRDTIETAARAAEFAASAAARIGHPIHDRWYSAQFWAWVARLVEKAELSMARMALVRAADKRVKEGTG